MVQKSKAAPSPQNAKEKEASASEIALHDAAPM
jgi:hypothetical protein